MRMLNNLKIKIDKRLLIFLFVLLLIAIIAGSILVCALNKSDDELLTNHMNNFINNIQNDNLDYDYLIKNNLKLNVTFIVTIWLLGISVIGLPIMIFLFFTKMFSLGFVIGTIFKVYGVKGFIFNVLYLFPSQFLNMLLILLLLMYAMTFSIKMIYAIFNKKTINFSLIMNTYFKILIISLLGSLIISLYDTFILPKLIKFFLSFVM